ncbi:hypothetical protein Tco_0845435, partial [Tanacetum coccineum]
YVSSENQANLHAGQQDSNQSSDTKDKIDAGDSEKEDESAQDCFELPIWHSYSSTNPFASKSDTKRGGPREEEQVLLDDLARLQRQEKESKEEVKEEDEEEEKSRKRKHGTRKKMKSRKRRFKQDTSQDDPSDIEKENNELILCLKIAPDEDKEVDYEILDKKYPIIDWKTQNFGTKPQLDESKRKKILKQ